MFRSIKTKMTIMVCTILLIILVLQILASIMFASDYSITQKSKQMENDFEMLCELAKNTDKDMVDIMDNYEDYSNLQYIIADEDFKTIFDNKQYKAQSENGKTKINANFNFEKYINEFSVNAKTKKIPADGDINSSLRLCGIIQRNDYTKYYIVISTSIDAIKQDMISTNIFTVYICIASMIVGGIGIYVLCKEMLQPIEEIENVAKKLAKMDFSIRANEGISEDEISSLAKSINIMADELEDNINKLKDHNKALAIENEYKERIDEMRKSFIANVSHELKTPIAILSGYAEILRSHIEGIDQDYYLDVIMDESKIMSDLVTNLLDLSHMENNLSKIDLEELNFNEFVEEIISKNEIILKEKNIKFIEKDKDLYVEGNRFYLEQVISNFLNNALKYVIPNGKIEITICKENKDAVFYIYDDGEKIEPDSLEKIWDSFYQVDKSRTGSNGKNIGLGLYIVRTIINAHQGKYGVKNNENGVTFWFSLKILK